MRDEPTTEDQWTGVLALAEGESKKRICCGRPSDRVLMANLVLEACRDVLRPFWQIDDPSDEEE